MARKAWLNMAFWANVRLRGKFLDLTIEIDKTRMDACDKRKAQANKDDKHSCSPTNLLEWHPRGRVQLHVPVLNDDQLSGCPWGSAFTCLVLEWAQTLRWPVEQTEHDPGVSLVELLINFILVTGVAFPRQVSRKAARVVCRHETQAAEVALIPCAFEEAMRTLDSIDFQCKRLFGLLLTPHELKCQGQFWRNYGCNKMRRGWTRRPEMLYPKETIETVTRAVHFGSFQSVHVQSPGPLLQLRPSALDSIYDVRCTNFRRLLRIRR